MKMQSLMEGNKAIDEMTAKDKELRDKQEEQ